MPDLAVVSSSSKPYAPTGCFTLPFARAPAIDRFGLDELPVTPLLFSSAAGAWIFFGIISGFALLVGKLRRLGIEPQFVLGIFVEPENFPGVLDENRFLARLLRHFQSRAGERRQKFGGRFAQLFREPVDFAGNGACFCLFQQQAHTGQGARRNGCAGWRGFARRLRRDRGFIRSGGWLVFTFFAGVDPQVAAAVPVEPVNEIAELNLGRPFATAALGQAQAERRKRGVEIGLAVLERAGKEN